ncbi:hypothetical protein BH09BAC4_BH09BAC4_13620 [soil metagenome]
MSVIFTELQQRRLFRTYTGIPFSSNQANVGPCYYLYSCQNYYDLWALKKWR